MVQTCGGDTGSQLSSEQQGTDAHVRLSRLLANLLLLTKFLCHKRKIEIKRIITIEFLCSMWNIFRISFPEPDYIMLHF